MSKKVSSMEQSLNELFSALRNQLKEGEAINYDFVDLLCQAYREYVSRDKSNSLSVASHLMSEVREWDCAIQNVRVIMRAYESCGETPTKLPEAIEEVIMEAGDVLSLVVLLWDRMPAPYSITIPCRMHSILSSAFADKGATPTGRFHTCSTDEEACEFAAATLSSMTSLFPDPGWYHDLICVATTILWTTAIIISHVAVRDDMLGECAGSLANYCLKVWLRKYVKEHKGQDPLIDIDDFTRVL